eukprot:TRINITY_DN8117_c0_g1_i3.p2 TRINITY_DN8117_c0_g1~~TRINITY_DN8117_c0_g1_i3.p2  ORF type:complete len:315 (-),score=46.00 TRINITY_DN8117_c0_g1_i3:87-1031(-)
MCIRDSTQSVICIAFHPKGNQLASGSADLTLKIWELSVFQCIKTLYGHEHSVSHLEFIHSGDSLISASRDKSIRVWEVSTGFCKKTIEGHDDWIRRVIVDNEENLMASCGNDQLIKIWNFKNFELMNILSGHEHVVECIIFMKSDETKKTITESDYNKKFLPKGASFEEAKKDSIDNSKSTSDQLSLQEKMQQYIQQAQQVNEQNSKYNKYSYLCSGSRDKSIKLWNCLTGQCIFTFLGHDNWVRGLSIHQNGKFLYSVSDDKSLRIWDLTTGKQFRKINEAHTQFVTCIDVKDKLPFVVTGGVDQAIKIWECK